MVAGTYGICVNLFGLLPYLLIGYIQKSNIQHNNIIHQLLLTCNHTNSVIDKDENQDSKHIYKLIYNILSITTTFVISISFFVSYIYHHQTKLMESFILTNNNTSLFSNNTGIFNQIMTILNEENIVISHISMLEIDFIISAILAIIFTFLSIMILILAITYSINESNNFALSEIKNNDKIFLNQDLPRYNLIYQNIFKPNTFIATSVIFLLTILIPMFISINLTTAGVLGFILTLSFALVFSCIIMIHIGYLWKQNTYHKNKLAENEQGYFSSLVCKWIGQTMNDFIVPCSLIIVYMFLNYFFIFTELELLLHK